MTPGGHIEPAIVLAWKETGLTLDESADPRLAGDWASVGTFLVWMDGHSGHDGWYFDPGPQRLVCACGTELYEVAPVRPVAA